MSDSGWYCNGNILLSNVNVYISGGLITEEIFSLFFQHCCISLDQVSLTRPEPPEKKIPKAKPKPDTMMLSIVKVFILFKNYTQVSSKVCKNFDSDELRLGFNYTFKFL